jgi:leucyl aminopeptidase
MKFQAKLNPAISQKSDCYIIPITEDKTQSDIAQQIDKTSNGLITKLIKSGDFKPSKGATFLLTTQAGCAAERIILIGTGKNTLTAEEFIKLVNSATQQLNKTAAKNAHLFFDSIPVDDHDESWKAQQTAKAFAASLYRYTTLKKSEAPIPTIKTGIYCVADKKHVSVINTALKVGIAQAAGISLARELGDLPGNICTPTYLASEARKLARNEPKLSTKALTEKQMFELGMGSLLSVSAGSNQDAKLIVMEYSGGKKSDQPTVLVGKGVTFDTGGISLKPGSGMDEMKFDMCGAASVLGTVKAIIEMELAINLVAIIAAAENMPSGGATKPGDVVTSMSGQTIEVLNTDAEGRLVLCDALTYAERFKPKAVIDIATLTGACVVALGAHATGLYSNNEELAEQLLAAGTSAQDKAWRMPLWDEYQSQLDSNFADIANIGGPKAGSVTAACFLSRFTKNYAWAHLDIAGTAWLSGGEKGSTGRPVSLLTQYLMQNA